MKSKLFIILFLTGSIIPNLLFAQFIQQGPKLVGTGGIGQSEQGISVAISSDGNTAIVGGYQDNSNAGAVWIFIRTGGVWTQQGPKLVGTGAAGNALQGTSVAISSDGNTVVVGGSYDNNQAGAVWIFTRSGGVWTQQGSKLVGTGSVGSLVYQGSSVSISADGNTVIEGGDFDNNSTGAVWVFTRSGGVWSQQGSKLVGTGSVGSLVYQGSSSAISGDGNTVIEGGAGDNNFAGAVWIFTRNGGVWTQQGTKLVGTGMIGQSGQGVSVALSSDGNTAVDAGYSDNTNVGAVWIFTRSGSVWTQQGSKLVGSGGIGQSKQGSSVAISSDGNTAIDGGYGDNTNAGAVWVFTRSGGVWTQQGPKLVGTGAVGIAYQGSWVAISADGSTVIEGGDGDNNFAGAVWFFYNSTVSIRTISGEMPKEFRLMQNYPNPFNPSSRIKFDISKSSFTAIKIYDILGREVAALVNEQLNPGRYEVNFDGTNLPSGVYFYKIEAGDFVETKKMILLK